MARSIPVFSEFAMGVAVLDVLGVLGDPGALGVLVLLVVGAFVCLLGYSYFRFSAGLAGLFVGMELARLLAIHLGWGTTARIAVCLLGGAALAALFAIFAFLGLFGLGAVLMTVFLSGAARAAGTSLGWQDVVLTALLGGFAGLLLRRFVAVVATSYYGGLMAMAALFTFFRRRPLGAAFALMGGAPGGRETVHFLLCVAVSVTGGLAVQFRFGKHRLVDGARR